MKFGDYTIRKGTKVKIFNPGKTKCLGVGTYVGSDKTEFLGCKINMPKFRLGHKIFRGFECWWIPLKRAKELEAKVAKEKRR